MASKVQPVIIPGSHFTETESEAFPDACKGVCSWHTLISGSKTPTDSLTAGYGSLPPNGGFLCPHRHKQAEIYFITQGNGIVYIDGVETEVGPNTTVFIPGDAEHGIKNVGSDDVKWFYVFPCDKFEDVNYRF